MYPLSEIGLASSGLPEQKDRFAGRRESCEPLEGAEIHSRRSDVAFAPNHARSWRAALAAARIAKLVEVWHVSSLRLWSVSNVWRECTVGKRGRK
jgi:hypothetical protein